MRVCMVCVLTHVFLPLTPCVRLELDLTVHWAQLLLAFIISQVFLELAFPRRGSLLLGNPLTASPQSCPLLVTGLA
jgi:hypothetical protein